MLDHEAAAVAMRTRLRSVSIATTGTMALAATSSGYSRSDGGSFITDGFRIGQEFLPAGFATNARHVITDVTASAITTPDTITVEASAAGRSLTVDLPETRVWENVKPMRAGVVFADGPTAGRPYVSDEWVPGTHEQVTFPANNARAEETGQYIVTVFGISDTGTAGIRSYTEAIAALFTPGTTITVGSDVVRIQKRGARAGQITPIANGWSYSQIVIPWYAETTNAVAA